MVNLEIPANYTNSPSSFQGTPHLTINRDATIDLDSSNSFEGPEKLLEVWFSPDPAALPPTAQPNGLKAVDANTWKEMLDLVNCKVLSVIESDHIDAYLLSESSMFVFPHKLVLKTCGTTTLLCGLPRMLEIAAINAGFPGMTANLVKATPAAATPYRVFYSRKNYLHPEKQRGPHRSWRDEVRFLDRMFIGGSAYMIGKMNGEHWYLYITGPDTRLTPPATPDSEHSPQPTCTETKFLNLPKRMIASAGFGDGNEDQQDETLEILMTDLDEENARQFYLDDASAVAEGRYFERAREARKDAVRSLGAFPEDRIVPTISGDGFTKEDPSAHFDVFEQTSSDHSDMSTEAEDRDSVLNFPEELTTEGHTLGTVVSESCGLADVYPTSRYPDAKIDAYLFTPCGFSANGVVPAPVDSSEGDKQAGHYFTVHVTPEPQCSYASFETNVPARQPGRETADIVEQVVRIFQPGRFSVTLFEAKDKWDACLFEEEEQIVKARAKQAEAARKNARMESIKGYRRVDRIVHDLDGYELVFRYYERLDWKGGVAPRLGEVD